MGFRQKKGLWTLPLIGAQITAGTNPPQVCFHVDDPLRSQLTLSGAFILSGEGYTDTDQALGTMPAWVVDLRDGLVGISITAVRIERDSTLHLSFADGRTLLVPDSTYETWHHTSTMHTHHAGVGSVAVWTP